MKKYSLYKTIQLILMIAVSAAVIIWVFPHSEVFHLLANDPTYKILAAAVWGVLLLSFLFIFLDYTFFFNYKKDYKEMELAASSDPVSGIANRFSCDVLIEKYMDKPLPNDIGVIMINLTNVNDINRMYGHLQGNMTIRDFSNVLRISSSDLCFVGRNGGINFLAIFEHGSQDKMQTFLERVKQRITISNRDVKNIPVEYGYGVAFSGTDNVGSITELISLANSRVTGSEL